MYKYKFNISGGYEQMGSAMAVFIDKEQSSLTEGINFSVDSASWGNLPEPSVDQQAEVVVSFEQPLTEKRLLNFKDIFKSLNIEVSGVA